MKKRRGFTLVELLAVIVILAIILAVAIPSITNVIDNAKISAYNDQVAMLKNASQKYAGINGIIPNNNNQLIVTLKNLQDNNLMATNVKDSRNNLTIPDTTGIVIKNINGTINYYYTGSVIDGLIANYDGINNGGFDTHNNNSSPNKAVWNDLTGNNDLILNNFDYTATSGWLSNGLAFDGSNDSFAVTTIPQYNDTSYTIEVYLSSNQYRYTELKFNTVSLKLRVVGQNEYWNTYNSGGTYQTTGIAYPNKITLNKNTYFSFTYDKTNNKYIYSKDGVFYNQNISSYTNPTMIIDYSSELMSGNIYAIRIYNKALTQSEIQYNYENDKSRFGI